ncbi:hypothetical protein RhiirA4_465564 [Rhizophagus irregularis]|uniref:Uncharacterized protein n=1 Tax=Rhizophagus irregularis TaxID=588596 RepID=A0A2I1GSA8_9GLOM|nr:hypothetical protein RhiirA4_465564 [Rhizophagus irregularis]
MLTIITNNRQIIKKYDKPFKVNSDRAIMNTKYRISKYLTSVFCGLPINLETRNKYYSRVHQLLMDKLVAIESRLKKQNKNRQTTTYIRFSFDKRVWYLGFYIPCSYCSNVYAYVMSSDRKVCQNCRSKVIDTPSPPRQNVFQDYSQVKQIISKRIGITYTKKVSRHNGSGNYAVTYSNLGFNKQFKSRKEQEKYKKRFFNSLKNNKNKWRDTSNSLKTNKNKWRDTYNSFESKTYISKYRLRRRDDILKKQHISVRKMEFLMDQVSSQMGYNALIEEIFVKHSFNEEHFLELRSKKEALFDLKNNIATEQSTNPIVAPWQEILEKKIAITKPEFHRRLNSVRDLDVLRIYSNGVKRKKRGYGVIHIYVDAQCSIRACKIMKGLWH